MSSTGCSCTNSDLLLAFHRELPVPALLRVQLHRLLCPECRERYRSLSEVSRQLASALNPRPANVARPLVSLWGALLLCSIALSAAAWSARACFDIPESSESCPLSPAPSTVRCEPAK